MWRNWPAWPRFGRETHPVLLVQHAFVDGLWPIRAEGRHTRVQLRQGNDIAVRLDFRRSTAGVSRILSAARLKLRWKFSVFNGRSGPMVSPP